MNGKTVLFLGLVITALFMYICIDTKKEELYALLVEKNESTIVAPVATPIVPKELKEEVSKPITIQEEKKEPSFAYVSGNKDKIAAFFSTQDKESNISSQLEDMCQNDNCIKDVQYFEDIAAFAFTKDTLGLISNSKKENIKDFALYINKKTLKIEGKFKEVTQEESIKPFLESFLDKGYTIENELKVETFNPAIKKEVVVLKEKIIKEEIIVEAPRDVFVTPLHLTLDEAAANINEIISSNNITFDYRSSEISKESKETLNEVIDILLGLDNVTIQVAGYTDSKGDTIYNKVLSQKRADAVRKYLIKSGIRSKLIKSKGYGEENFISNPEDTINRRVEIHLKEEK